MNVRKVVALLAISLLFAQVALAQTKGRSSVIPYKVMEAEFQSLDDSASVRLSAYRNRVVVLAVWASWCPPCRTVMETLNALHKDSSMQGVEVIGLTVEDPNSEAQSVRSFVRDYEIKFKVGWIGEEMGKALIEQDSIPQIFVIAGDGLIVKRFIGWHPDKTRKLLRRIVKQARTSPPVMQ